MRYSLITLIGVLLVLSLRGGAQPLQDLPYATNASASPIVAELFTSQSCSSCPPAEKLFSELANRGDLIVLEWHVDYWDKLVHGRAGSWKDPYSSPEHTARQRQYNRAIRGTGGVFTPQAVINGSSETVGSRHSEVDALLSARAHKMAKIDVTKGREAVQVEIGAYQVALDRPADIYRLTLLPAQVTSVPSGENRGVRLFSRNIVLKSERVGSFAGDPQSLSLAPSMEGESCAIIVQEKRGNRLGPILAASYC